MRPGAPKEILAAQNVVDDQVSDSDASRPVAAATTGASSNADHGAAHVDESGGSVGSAAFGHPTAFHAYGDPVPASAAAHVSHFFPIVLMVCIQMG